MKLKRTLIAAAIAATFTAAGTANAQVSDGIIKIGVMNDQSGTYADLAGPGSVVAAKMAIEDFGAAKKGMKVEIISADHQNKPDVASNVARQWFDVDKVDIITGTTNSGVALAVSQVTKDKGKAFIVSGGAAFGGGCYDRFRQSIVFAQAFREAITVNLAFADRVAIPQRSCGDAGNIATHDDFDWKRIDFSGDQRIRIRQRDFVIVNYVSGLIEPPRGQLIQHLALVWHARQNPIERRQPISGDEQSLAVLQLVPVPHLARLLAGQGQMCFA